ncbi:MAG: multidrug effflux MFS transporter [Burkholderiaceae bacterium]|nr:multidrug effflux MFS transporter [Burkholderiaceae bacterium]
MIGPFAIDTYLPAFAGIATSLDASPVQMQQTLSVYLFGFAFMNLFHGAISDTIGRKPVILAGLGMFTLASIGCAMSTSIGALVFFRGLQGLSTGAGIVVSRAVIRDLFPQDQAQRMMSLVTIIFGIAPAVAPIVGGWLFVHTNWHAIFWFLAGLGVLLLIANWRLLPESHPVRLRQPFHLGNLMRGYRELVGSARFLLLCLASGIPFNGMFLYVLASPAFLGEHLGLAPTEFWWFFVSTISGIMAGAWLSGRVAGRISPRRQIRIGFVIMTTMAVSNAGLNLVFVPDVSWALIPISLFAFGWALMVPVITLLVLDLFPARRGMASSLQAVVGSAANGVVAGVIAPAVMHSTVALALASLTMMSVGLVAWFWLGWHWPDVGRRVRGEAD